MQAKFLASPVEM